MNEQSHANQEPSRSRSYYGSDTDYFSESGMLNDDVSRHQSEYVRQMSKLNHSNTDYIVPDSVPKQQKNDFDEIFDDVEPSPRNALKCAVVGITCIIICLFGYLLVTSPVVKSAIAQNVLVNSNLEIVDSEGYDDEFSHRDNADFATNVTLIVHGNESHFDTVMRTVGDVLNDKSVKILGGDGVYPSEDKIVGDNATIYVDKSVISSEIVVVSEPFEILNSEDGTIQKGQEVVVQEGIEGKIQDTDVVWKVADKETKRLTVSSITLAQPTTRIVKIGTYEPPKPTISQSAPMVVPDSEVKQYALEQVLARGWGQEEFNCLVPLWSRESGWRVNAGNPISGAYGIPQALPGSKMASAGDDWRTNPMTQVRWGLGYIAGRYGTPCNAWGVWQSKGWY